MLSANSPQITRVRYAIRDLLAEASEAGRITPAIRDFPPYIDPEKHKNYPALVVKCGEERAHDARGQQVAATLFLTAVLNEPRDDRADDEIEHFTWQIGRELLRPGRVGDALLEIQRIRYDEMRRKDQGALTYAVMQIGALYHGGN